MGCRWYIDWHRLPSYIGWTVRYITECRCYIGWYRFAFRRWVGWCLLTEVKSRARSESCCSILRFQCLNLYWWLSEVKILTEYGSVAGINRRDNALMLNGGLLTGRSRKLLRRGRSPRPYRPRGKNKSVQASS